MRLALGERVNAYMSGGGWHVVPYGYRVPFMASCLLYGLIGRRRFIGVLIEMHRHDRSGADTPRAGGESDNG